MSGIPVILSKNAVNYNKLYDLSVRHNLPNKVGWILDVAMHLFELYEIPVNSTELKKTVDKLWKIKSNEEQVFSFDLDSKTYREFARLRRDKLAEKWNICDPYTLEPFKERFEIYVTEESKPPILQKKYPAYS